MHPPALPSIESARLNIPTSRSICCSPRFWISFADPRRHSFLPLAFPFPFFPQIFARQACYQLPAAAFDFVLLDCVMGLALWLHDAILWCDNFQVSKVLFIQEVCGEAENDKADSDETIAP